MAIRDRLTVGDIQIYFDGQVARYSCPRSLELLAVEAELEKWQTFVERWLGAAELPKPVLPSREEIEFLALLRRTAAGFKRTKLFEKDQIVKILPGLAEQLAAMRFPTLTADQRKLVVDQATSSL
jgi:hypothetical protein